MSFCYENIATYLKRSGWIILKNIEEAFASADIFNLFHADEQYQIILESKEKESYYAQIVSQIAQIEDRSISLVQEEILASRCAEPNCC